MNLGPDGVRYVIVHPNLVMDVFAMCRKKADN